MDPSDLVEGKVYFFCGFVHPEIPVPELEAFVFIGTEKGGEGLDYVFEDPRKHFEKQITDELDEDQMELYQPPREPTKTRIPKYLIEDTVYSMNEMIRFVNSIPEQEGAGEFF